MLIGTLSLIAGLAASAAAGAVPKAKADFSCGVRTPTRGQIATHRKLASLESAARLNGVTERANINVDLYFHVVSASQGGVNSLDVSPEPVTQQHAERHRTSSADSMCRTA